MVSLACRDAADTRTKAGHTYFELPVLAPVALRHFSAETQGRQKDVDQSARAECPPVLPTCMSASVHQMAAQFRPSYCSVSKNRVKAFVQVEELAKMTELP
ncbi:hypothetical protein MRX96_007369 [Rhipicephalus microplus]